MKLRINMKDWELIQEREQTGQKFAYIAFDRIFDLIRLSTLTVNANTSIRRYRDMSHAAHP